MRAADDDVDVDGEAAGCHRVDDAVDVDGVDDADDVLMDVVDVMVALLLAVSWS